MSLNFNSYSELLSKIEEFYNEIGPKFELIYPNLKESNRILAQSIIDNISLPNNARIADLGCGSGWLLKALSELNPKFNLFGFDASDKSINVAKDNLEKVNSNIHFQTCDWMNIQNVVHEKFDFIICIGNTLTHFTEEIQKTILKEFSFLLREEGSALIDTYKGWNEMLNDLTLFEPKGLTKNENDEIFSCIFSEYRQNLAIRNLCFAHYTNEGTTAPRTQSYEQYVTYQFRFILSQTALLNECGFKSISEINLDDAINIFSYYYLVK